MKKTTLLKTVLAFSIVLVMNSCSKDNTFPCTRNCTTGNIEVEYKITPFSNSIISVSYTDSLERQVTTGLFEDFTGTQKIIVPQQNFLALLTASVSNMAGEDLDFSMSISINGQIVKQTNYHEPSHWPGYVVTDSLEFKMQIP